MTKTKRQEEFNTLINVAISNSSFYEGVVERNIADRVEKRATGRSYRLANDIIDRFFSLPIGTKIAIIDHFPDSRANDTLARMVSNILNGFFSLQKGRDFEIKRRPNGIFEIERLTPTFQEMNEKGFNIAMSKLEEVNEEIKKLEEKYKDVAGDTTMAVDTERLRKKWNNQN